jgi:hypothetical protein
LIGEGCDCLIPSNPPKEARDARQRKANDRFRGDYVHTIKGPGDKSGSQKKGSKKQGRFKTGQGYRPDRKAAQHATKPQSPAANKNRNNGKHPNS